MSFGSKFPQPSIEQTSRISDAVTTALCAMGLIPMVAFAVQGYWIDVVVLLIAICLFYVVRFITQPLARSQRLEDPRLLELLETESIEFRSSRLVETSALQIPGRNVIIIAQRDLESVQDTLIPKVAHEIAHIRFNDSILFHIAAITLMATSALTILIVLWAAVELNLRSTPINSTIAQDQFATLLLGALAFLFSATLALWTRKTLHDREYRADRFAHLLLGSRYTSLIERLARRESLTKRTGFMASPTLQSFVSHPSFWRRLQTMRNDTIGHSMRIWSTGALLVLVMMVGFAACYGSFLAFTQGYFLPLDTQIPFGQWGLALLLAMFVGLCGLVFTPMSLAVADRALLGGSTIRLLEFAFAFALSAFAMPAVLFLVFYGVYIAFGQDTDLSLSMVAVLLNDWIGAIYIAVFGSFPIYTAGLQRLLISIRRRASLSLLQHYFAGFMAAIAAFYTPRAIFEVTQLFG